MAAERFVPLVALALMVSGCAYQTPPISAAAGPPSTSFDGTYVGSIQVISSASGPSNLMELCTMSPRLTVTVVNGAFTYSQWQPRDRLRPVVVYSAAILPNGEVRGIDDSRSRLVGRVNGRLMEGTIRGPDCYYGFSVQHA